MQVENKATELGVQLMKTLSTGSSAFSYIKCYIKYFSPYYMYLL